MAKRRGKKVEEARRPEISGKMGWACMESDAMVVGIWDTFLDERGCLATERSGIGLLNS